METKDLNLVKILKQEKMNLNQNLGLYNTMVYKTQVYSRTENQIHEMNNFKDDLKKQVNHIDYKITSCLNCEKILNCKTKCGV
jgi:hypothetical protein